MRIVLSLAGLLFCVAAFIAALTKQGSITMMFIVIGMMFIVLSRQGNRRP